MEKMEPISSLPFFIPDRLRGIPLVSSRRAAVKTTQTPTLAPAKTSTQEEREVLADLIGVSSGQNGRRTATRSVGAGERLGSASVANSSSLLMSAASMSNQHQVIVNQRTNKPAATTTSTRRPQASSSSAQRTRPRTGGGTSSGRPARASTTTTTTTIRPTTTRLPIAKAQLPARARSLASNTQSTEPKISQRTNVNSSNSNNGANQSNKLTNAAKLVESKIVRNSNGVSSSSSSSSSSSVGYSNEPALSRTTQQAAAQSAAPQVDQWRTTPTQTVSSRYTNRPNSVVNGGQFAGENWSLFNRPDGRFSVFEVLVIMSNVMIVATIVLVILFSWIKSTRRKRHLALLKEQAAMQPQETLTLSSSRSPSHNQLHFDGQSDRASKISMISSGVGSSQTAGALPSALKHSSPSGYVQYDQHQQQQQQQQQLNGNNLIQQAESYAARVSPAQRVISSEIKGAAGALANKAMAIVQPTEAASSQATVGSAHSDSEKLASALKEELAAQVGGQAGRGSSAISRSVSDLSAGAIRQKLGGGGGAQIGAAPPSEQDRVAALEQLFSGRGEQQSGKPTVAAAAAAANAAHEGKPQLGNGGRRMSAGSLESIELPPTLVESIKRSDPKNPANAEAPSPNLLLGELGGAVAGVARAAQTSLVAGIKGQLDQAAKVGANLASEITSKAVAALEQLEAPQLEQQQQQQQQQPPPVPMPKGGKEGEESVKKPGGNTSKVAPEGASVTAAADSATNKKKLPSNSQEPIAGAAATGGQKGAAAAPAPASNKAQPKATANPNSQRPVNPVGAEMDLKDQTNATGAGAPKSSSNQTQAPNKPTTLASNVKNHQVVVNKLDKRKTNLEIVDLRDDSVTGKMRNGSSANKKGGRQEAGPAGGGDSSAGWISMDGVAVVQQAPASQPKGQASSSNPATPALGAQSPIGGGGGSHPMSPSEIIESRFHVDYSSKRRQQSSANKFESLDSKTEEYTLNNIENELEQDNKMRNRKYFVYIVHDGHFTAKKECIARIELPPKRRITLAELRQLIANSQDISLSSLRRNRFKFVTETYRLLNENEDAAVLHQIYPTQGVFLKLNIPEQETPSYLPYKSRARLSSSSTNLAGGGAGGGGGGGGVGGNSAASSVAQQTIASRRRMVAPRAGQARPSVGGSARGGGGGERGSGQPPMVMAPLTDGDSALPAIEVDEYAHLGSEQAATRRQMSSSGGSNRARASSVGRANNKRAAEGSKASSYKATTTSQPPPARPTAFRRSKSNAQARRFI